LSVQAGYNLAAESFDGELGLTRQFGSLRLLAAARGMSHGYGRDTARFALAGGASLQFLRWFALAGDVRQLVDKQEGEDLAWGAALQIAIPYTPHTLSLQVTNTNTMTLQGSSRGASQKRYGFEFTIPIHPARFLGRQPETATRASGPSDTGAPDVSGSGPT